MEFNRTEDRPVVVDISSDEGSPPMVGSNDDFDWLGELLCEDVVAGLAAEDDEDDDVVVIGEFSPLKKSRKRKLKGSDYGNDVAVADDDECLLLDGDPDKLVAVEGGKGNHDGSDSDDLLVVGEKGQVACRDYPHPRHDCVKFPFNTTSHEKHCDLCHCYVCDSLAPCVYWGKGLSNSDHCHATDKDGDWKIRRKDLKLGKSAGENTFSIDNGTAQIVLPLPAQTLHLGRMSSAAIMNPQNLVSQQMMAHQASQTIIPGSMPIPTKLTPNNLVPRQAIYCPRSKTSLYGNTTSPANSSLARQKILQRCSSSVPYRSSDHIYTGVRKQQSGNFKIGLQPHAPGRLSRAIDIARPDGHHVRSNMRPQHTSSVQRFNKTGIVYRPSVSRAGYVSNNPSRSPQVHHSGKFSEYTPVNGGLNKIFGQNGLSCTDFPSDVSSGLLNATGTLPNMGGHPQSSIFCSSSGGMSTDLQNVSPIYQHIEDATPLNQSNLAHHQNLGGPLHHGAVVTMDSAAAAPRPQPPIQQSNHHLPQEFDLCSMAMNNNWWPENELPQGPIPLEPPDAAVDIGMLLFDFEASWNDVTR